MLLKGVDTMFPEHQQGTLQALLINIVVVSYMSLFWGHLDVSSALGLVAICVSVKSLTWEFETVAQLALLLAGQEVTQWISCAVEAVWNECWIFLLPQNAATVGAAPAQTKVELKKKHTHTTRMKNKQKDRKSTISSLENKDRSMSVRLIINSIGEPAHSVEESFN